MGRKSIALFSSVLSKISTVVRYRYIKVVNSYGNSKWRLHHKECYYVIFVWSIFE